MTEIYKVIKSEQVADQEYEVTFQTIEDKMTLILHEELVLKYRLVVGKEVASEVIQNFYVNLNYGKAYQAALKILTRQAYSSLEVRQKLEAQKFEAPLVEEVLKKLEEVGLLNDEQYTISYIQHHQLLGKKGPNILKQELLRKGISEQVITSHLTMYNEEQQLEHAMKMVKQQLQVNKTYGPYLLRKKIYQHLITKGFGTEVIEEALANIEPESDDEHSVLTTQVRKLINKYKALTHDKQRIKVTQALMRKGFKYDDIGRVYDQIQEECDGATDLY